MDEAEPAAAASTSTFNYGLQASTFSVDCLGQRAVLAVQKWLAVVSLEALESSGERKPLRKLGRANKYEIKGVLWNPHKSKHGLMASTCQQKVEVWDVDAERHPLLQSFKAHTRPVSDMSWSFTEPGLIASCSTDAFIHIWDIRDSKKPSISFKAVAGATLVQWNRLSGDLVASAHDSDIRIWDRRKPSTPSGYITAHTSRIHNLDWSHASQLHLTTCSHDGSIKFWNTRAPREPTDIIKAAAHPLWRARNYPGGDAIALLLVPTLHGGDSRVFLWNRTNPATPTHVLSGHLEAVLEVQWLNEERLASWSRDRTLRIWTVNEQLRLSLGGSAGAGNIACSGSQDDGDRFPSTPSLSVVGSGLVTSTTPTDTPNDGSSSAGTPLMKMSFEEIGSGEVLRGRGSLGTREDPTLSLPVNRTLGPSDSLSTVGGSGGFGSSGSPSTHSLTSLSSISSQSTLNPVFQSIGGHSLAKEFAQLRTDDISNLEVEKSDTALRSCTVRAWQGSQLVRVAITFPAHYPNGAAPSFMFHQSTTLPITGQLALHRNLTEQASLLVKQNKPCLEVCLHFLSKSLGALTNRPTPPKQSPDLDRYGRLDDKHIPFPRTSGARFSAGGLLVCFNSPSGLTGGENIKTPRSLNKMTAYTSRIHPAVMGGAVPRWSSHAFHSASGSTSSSTEVGVPRVGGDQGSGGNPLTAPVTVYSATSLLPIDLQLAKAYSLSGGSVEEICSQNASLAAQRGRADLVKAWSTAALVASEIGLTPPSNPTSMPWPKHPFCRSLIKSLFLHFARLHDIQTLAMLACVFQEHCKRTTINMRNRTTSSSQQEHPSQKQQQQQTKQPSPPDRLPPKIPYPPLQTTAPFSFFGSSSSRSNGSSPPKKIFSHHHNNHHHQQQQQHLASSSSPSDQELNGSGNVVSSISSSWQEVQMMDTCPLPPFSEVEDPLVEEQNYHDKQCWLLDSTMILQCDEFRRSYCDILYAWSLLEQRAEVLKYQVNNPPAPTSKKTGIVPSSSKNARSLVAKWNGFTCSICNLSVKGCSNLCMACGHGGHTQHLMNWFNKHAHCPTGCGCACLQASGWS